MIQRCPGATGLATAEVLARVEFEAGPGMAGYWEGIFPGEVPTGAEKVIVFDHTIRTAERAVERGYRAPVQMVHNDYTDKSGPQRVRDLLPPEEAEARLKHRFVEINVWRPIKGPVQAWPLALADAQSIAPAATIPATAGAAVARGNDAHRLVGVGPMRAIEWHPWHGDCWEVHGVGPSVAAPVRDVEDRVGEVMSWVSSMH